MAFVACLLAGRPYLPLDPLLPPAGQRELLEQAGAVLLDRQRAEEGFSSGLSCPLPDDPHRIAYEIFTSGSTGKPKLVEVSLSNLEHFLQWASALPDIAAILGGTAVGQAAWSFDLSVADLYLSLLGGGTHVALTPGEKEDFPALFRRLEASGLSLLVATPSFLLPTGCPVCGRSFPAERYCPPPPPGGCWSGFPGWLSSTPTVPPRPPAPYVLFLFPGRCAAGLCPSAQLGRGLWISLWRKGRLSSPEPVFLHGLGANIPQGTWVMWKTACSTGRGGGICS